MRVELLAVGTELLLGDIVNGNAAWLGQQLAAAGVDVHGSGVVGDNVARIAGSLRSALGRADAVVLTGGLGPTQDDLTREALAELVGVELVRDPVLEQAITERYAAYGRSVPPSNLRMADVPRGGTAMPNPRGTAPGIRLPLGGRVAYALPGVPHEMEEIFTASVLPDLLERAGQPAAIVSRVLRVVGRWESGVAEALGPLVEELDHAGNPTVAFLASGGEVKVRITAKAADRRAALELLGPAEGAARAALGADVYGADGDTLPTVVHGLLRRRAATVAAAESLTGGLLGALLSEAPGSSESFRGAVVAYATELKTTLLGVPSDLLAERGPAHSAVAQAMAEGVRERLGATYGVALSGVAGPDPQGTAAPGTLYLAVAGPNGGRSWARRVPGDRGQVRRLAALMGLDALRRTLLREASG